DWEFIQWLAETYAGRAQEVAQIQLTGLELLQWLVRWGRHQRLELKHQALRFEGQMIDLVPHLENGEAELCFTQRLLMPDKELQPLEKAKFFLGRPPLALIDRTFYLLRNGPPAALLEYWAKTPCIPVGKLSHRLRTHLRKTQSADGLEWEQLCVTHQARPQFVFELSGETVRLRLLARSERDQSVWHWTGQEWLLEPARLQKKEKPEILEDPRLESAVQWLRRLDWFTPEPGVWVGDANEEFLNTLALAWPDKPEQAEYLGNPAFHRLFLAPRQLRPRLIVKGSGIDWLAVSAEWEAEGLKLTTADLQRLQTATGRFVKLPDAGWLELDTKTVEQAHETMADLGLENLSATHQRVGLGQAAHLDENGLSRFAESAEAKELRQRLQ